MHVKSVTSCSTLTVLRDTTNSCPYEYVVLARSVNQTYSVQLFSLSIISFDVMFIVTWLF